MKYVNVKQDGYLGININQDTRVINGYVLSGGIGEQDIVIHESVLPYNFYDEFIVGKFKYYRETGEVIEDYNFIPPDIDDIVVEEPETVSKQEFDNLKNKFEEMQKLLDKLLGGK
ncbi:methyltransferase subunit G [Mammaliicoccus virus vB_MscM-PMS2]|nr:methyltransferase subunit G [Mammaliicoccus virus vB_MscM-PMS2]